MMTHSFATTLLMAAVTGLTTGLSAASAAEEAGDAGHVNYAPPYETAARPAFIPLPPGAVEPKGWLRDWCLAARDGYTGNMDEYDDEFKRVWAADHKMTGEDLFWYRGAWPYEGGGYWFDGLVRLGYALHDEAMIQQATSRLYAVADRMHGDALAKHTGHAPEIKVENIADFERNSATYDVDNEMKELFAFDPDLVILAIGENVPGLSSAEACEQFQAGVRKILKGVLAERRPIVVVRSCFWADPAKDQVLREVCQEVNGIFVDAGPLGEDSANAARSERPIAHAGVAGHPGDRGMRAIADLVVEAVLAR